MIKNITLTDEEFFKNSFPGATRILGELFGKDEFKEIPEVVLKEATDRGSAVHKYIETFIKTEQWPDVELAYQVYIDYFIDWYFKYKPKFITSELKLINFDDQYKGIIDTIFEYEDPETHEKITCMCDWKTSSNLNRFKTMCQLNLYNKMFKKYFPKIKINELRVLSITKTGYRFSKFEINHKLCSEILDLYRLKKIYE